MFGQTEMNYVVGNCAAVTPPGPVPWVAAILGHEWPSRRQGNPVAPGELGEVACSRLQWRDGPGVHARLLEKSEEATQEKVLGGDRTRRPGGTGDLAKLDEDGVLWYQGRSDDMFKSGGYRIGPAEIENCLVKHAAVANAAVIGEPDETRGTVVKAFIVLQVGATPGELEASLQDHVRRFLAPYEYAEDRSSSSTPCR
jgi:acetyl-CoA synthetase